MIRMLARLLAEKRRTNALLEQVVANTAAHQTIVTVPAGQVTYPYSPTNPYGPGYGGFPYPQITCDTNVGRVSG